MAGQDGREGEGRGRFGRRRRQPASAELSDAAGRARAAWEDLCAASMLRRGGGQLLVMDGPGSTATICGLRPLVQVLLARLDIDRLELDQSEASAPAPDSPSLDDLADTLELYRWGDGYADLPGTDAVSSEDNTLVTFAALQAHAQLDPPAPDSIWLHRAKRTFEVVTAGPTYVDLAGRLFLATGIERYALITADADLAVHVEIDAGDGLWARPPADNAARFVAVLAQSEHRSSTLAELDRYLERVWREGRDPASGQFTAGGIGRSPHRGPTLDHAAIVQLYARQALFLGPSTRPSEGSG